MVEVTDSLLQYRSNYDRKMFYSAGHRPELYQPCFKRVLVSAGCSDVSCIRSQVSATPIVTL